MMFKPLELISIICSVVFVLCIIRQKIIGWVFGITASVCSVIYFYQEHLISSAWLNLVYVAFGIYGWVNWGRKKGVPIPIRAPFKLNTHFAVILVCVLSSLLLAYVFSFFPKEISYPAADALLAVFSLAATTMEARKQLSAWPYWIIVNFCAGVFYTWQGSYGYGILSFAFTLFSIQGLLTWKKDYESQLAN